MAAPGTAIQRSEAQQKWAYRPVRTRPCRRGLTTEQPLPSAACPVLPELPCASISNTLQLLVLKQSPLNKQQDCLSHNDQMTEAQTKTFPSNFQLSHVQILLSLYPSPPVHSLCLHCAMTPRETKEQVACGVILRREGGVSCSARSWAGVLQHRVLGSP